VAKRRRSFDAIRYTLIALGLVWSAFPIAMVVLSSFKEASQIFEVPPRLLFAPTLDNYRTLWTERPEFFRALRNSLAITAGATIVTLFAATLAGYVYARFRSRFLSASAFGLLAVRMLPPIIVTVPLFPVLNALRMNDTHLLLILLYAAFYVSLGTWVMRSFVAALPIELEEAASVDGAGLLQILVRVVLPLVVPGLIAIAIFVVVFAWNEYVFALIFTTRNAKTAPVIIGEMLGTVEGVQWGVIFAAATVQLVPVLALVIALQRYLIAGLTAGAVKQ
jgi:multiple sugar transport system permease protein